MRSSLIFLATLLSAPILTGAPPAQAEGAADAKISPILWRFPGDYGPDLREAIAEAAEDANTRQHLIHEAQIDAWLDGLPRDSFRDLGCLDDSARCEQPQRAVGHRLGLSAIVQATLKREDSGQFSLTLKRTPASGGAPQTYTLSGGDLPTVARKALKQLGGFFGAVAVQITPEQAEIYSGDQRLGVGPGTYELPVGDHTLRATAPGYAEASEKITVGADGPTPLVLTLRATGGTVVLNYSPGHAVVYTGGAVFAKKPGVYTLPPGEHVLRIEARGYRPHEVTAQIAAGQKTPIKISLKADESLFANLPPADPITTARPYYVRAGYRGLTVTRGDYDVGGDDLELTRIGEAITMNGFEVGVGWRGDLLIIEPLTLTYAGRGGPTDASLSRGGTGTVDDFSRLLVRPAWVGVQRPIGALVPYALGGLILGFESFEIRGEDPDGDGPLAAPSDDDAGRISLTLGLEMGLRYQITEAWFVDSGLEMAWWPGDQPTFSFLLGGGFAFNWPEEWPRWW